MALILARRRSLVSNASVSSLPAMVWRRRKAPAPPGPTLAELLAPWNDATCPVLTRTTRMERALVSLATHTAQLRKRVDAMEQRVDGRELMMTSAPSRVEMDELREQSARLARDLARLSIDLREELAKAVDAVRLAQVANANAERRRERQRAHQRALRRHDGPAGRARGHRPHRDPPHLSLTSRFSVAQNRRRVTQRRRWSLRRSPRSARSATTCSGWWW